MPPFSHHRAAALALAVAAVSGCVSGPSRWIPAEAPGSRGHCSREHDCSWKDPVCMDQLRADNLLCEVDRVQQEAPRVGAVASFDALARFILAKDGHCAVGYEAPRVSREALVGFYPAVHKQMEDAFAAGRIDLAARRALFVEYVVAH